MQLPFPHDVVPVYIAATVCHVPMLLCGDIISQIPPSIKVCVTFIPPLFLKPGSHVQKVSPEARP